MFSTFPTFIKKFFKLLFNVTYQIIADASVYSEGIYYTPLVITLPTYSVSPSISRVIRLGIQRAMTFRLRIHLCAGHSEIFKKELWGC